ncbi:MAG: helix-turn-helix transcriptional regulator [Clostridia bacterium]|jgi:transcriptional regulator with XRE-family HTH domain|nr:helix-turn-helix transcriptional regulator [Clostridia bacterium]
MIKSNKIHQKLAEAIKNSGISQSELARRLNLSQSNISHYIKGDKMPSLETFANLCAVLDLDANDILCKNLFNQ